MTADPDPNRWGGKVRAATEEAGADVPRCPGVEGPAQLTDQQQQFVTNGLELAFALLERQRAPCGLPPLRRFRSHGPCRVVMRPSTQRRRSCAWVASESSLTGALTFGGFSSTREYP
jgi:hypothetical protein